MGVGPGLIQGVSVEGVYDISPSGAIYEGSSGLNFTAQTASNVGFYEVTSQSDSLQFRVPDIVAQYDDAVLTLNTVFGPTDFDVIEVSSGATLISETSGFDSDVWRVFTSNDGATLEVTNFDDTTAALYPYLGVAEVQ